MKTAETDETKETIFERLKSFIGLKTEKTEIDKVSLEKSHNTDDDLTDETQTTAKTDKHKLRIKKFIYGVKRPKNEVKGPVKSLRVYIKRKWKWVILMF